MRLVGIDFGFQRIGVAIAVTEPRAISVRPIMQASGVLKKDAEVLAHLVKKEEADALVLGMPYLEDAPDGGKMQRIVDRLANEIRSFGVVVYQVDESLTSTIAESRLYDSGLKASQRKKVRDSEAAAVILERYLDEYDDGKCGSEA